VQVEPGVQTPVPPKEKIKTWTANGTLQSPRKRSQAIKMR
jgi:hypothetical protein